MTYRQKLIVSLSAQAVYLTLGIAFGVVGLMDVWKKAERLIDPPLTIVKIKR